MLYTVFDVETSDLDPGCDVLSFAYSLCDENFNIMRSEVLYFWKEGVTQWTEEAYQINKLSKDFLRQYADDYEKNLKKMYVVLSMADLVGYNSGFIRKDGIIGGFDFSRCKEFLKRNGFPAPEPRSFTDIMRIYQRHHAGYRAKLTKAFAEYKQSQELAAAICETYFNDPASNPHCASFDVAMTMLLFLDFYRKGWIDKEDPGDDCVEQEEPKSALNGYKLSVHDDLILYVEFAGQSVPITEFMKINPVDADELLNNMAQYMVQEA